MRWLYKGPDAELGDFGKVGYTSVIEATGAQIKELGGDQFELVSDREPINIVPFGAVKYEPDVTGLTAEEAQAKRTEVVESEEAKVPEDAKDPARETKQERYKKLAVETAANDKKAAAEAARLSPEPLRPAAVLAHGRPAPLPVSRTPKPAAIHEAKPSRLKTPSRKR